MNNEPDWRTHRSWAVDADTVKGDAWTFVSDGVCEISDRPGSVEEISIKALNSSLKSFKCTFRDLFHLAQYKNHVSAPCQPPMRMTLLLRTGTLPQQSKDSNTETCMTDNQCQFPTREIECQMGRFPAGRICTKQSSCTHARPLSL